MTTSNSNLPSSSEAYRQNMVRDGQKRFEEWHGAYETFRRQYQTEQEQQRQQRSLTWVTSENYRKNLVRDGQQRFQEWHQNFLNYQRRFLAETQKRT